MRERQCPKCGSKGILTERRPDGDSSCFDCGFKGKTYLFDGKTHVSADKPPDFQVIDALVNEYDAVSKLEVALEALRFYADQANYLKRPMDEKQPSHGELIPPAVLIERGSRAKLALRKIEGMK